MLITPEQFYMENLFANTKQLISSIVPLQIKENNRNYLEGSSVYIKIDNRFFLITASHIAEKSTKLMVQIENDWISSIPTNNFYAFGEPADIAIAELNHELKCYKPLSYSDVAFYRNLPNNGVLIALGYPVSKSKVYSNEATLNFYGFATFEESIHTYNIYNTDNYEQLILYFDKHNMMDKNGFRTTTPNPYGISGGGLFWFPEKSKIGISNPFLVGIMTRWDDRKEKYFFATQTSLLKKLLYDKFGVNLMRNYK
jgi:hypothetical protein